MQRRPATPPPLRAGRASCIVGTSLALVLAGCGGGGGTTPAPASAVVAPPPDCSAATTAVARRVYDQGLGGADLREATRRLRTSRPLADAVARGDRSHARRILAGLDRDQFAEVRVLRRGHVVAQLGSGAPALAPVAGRLAVPGTRFVVSVGGDAGFARMVAMLTGGGVTVSAHGRTVAAAGRVAHAGGRVAHAADRVAHAAAGARTSFAASAYPHGRLRVGLALPPAGAGCDRASAMTAVARRILVNERDGAATHRVLRHVGQDPGFRAAVAADDPVGLRAAIIRFFRTPSLHVVRIRATQADHTLVGDVGGPDVLSPASAPVRDAHGRRIGTVTLSVQDDTGYEKLVHAFTGDGINLRSSAGPIPGAFPPPADAGATTTRLMATAFPAGPLAVSLRS